MSHYEKTFSLDIGDDVDRNLEAISEFYRHNGYELDDEGDETKPVFRRGEPGSSWFSSKMTDLATEVTVDTDDSALLLHYRVETTGQHLTDEDRNFWTREADAAADYLNGDQPLTDLRPLEVERVKELRGELRGVGLWAMGIVFVIIFVVGIIGDRIGCI